MLHRRLWTVTTVGAMTIGVLTAGFVSKTGVVAQDLPTAGQFDAASVKVHRTPGGTTRRIEQERLTYLNITLGELVQMAYNVKHYQIEAASWVIDYGSSDRYDVIAKAAMPASPDSLRAMLAPLLVERFHLAEHRETRVLPVYVLVVAKGGPKFKDGDGEEKLVMPDGSGAMKYQNYPMPDRAPIDMIVVDRAERVPTAD